MQWNRNGISREVILTKRYAYKFPKLRYGWKQFLHGLLANMQERSFAKAGWPELCPVVWSIPGGWLIVMRRAEPISEDDWQVLGWESAHPRDVLEPWISRSSNYVIPAERKPDSFGWLDGQIVAVDYGN